MKKATSLVESSYKTLRVVTLINPFNKYGQWRPSEKTKDNMETPSANKRYDFLQCHFGYEHLDKLNTLLNILEGFAFIMSVVVLLQNFAGSISCTERSLCSCHPQFTLQIKENSSEAIRLLSSIREFLKMLSYIAKDLSININNTQNLLSEINYRDIIDTFSEHNLYKFNFKGYCRLNQLNMQEICIFSDGLDIFSTLVRDIGLQLGNTLKVNNPKEISDSLIVAFSEALVSLNEVYLKGKSQEFGYENLRMEPLTLVHKVIHVTEFAYIMSLLATLSVIISTLATTSLGIISIIFTLYKGWVGSTLNEKYKIKILLLSSVLSFFQIFVHFIVITSQGFYYNLHVKLFQQINIASIQEGSGFHMIIINLILAIIIQFLILFVYFKRKTYNVF